MSHLQGRERIGSGIVVAALMALLSTPALAQVGKTYAVGGFELGMDLEALGIYTDNFYYEPDDGTDGYGALLRPRISLSTDQGRFSFSTRAAAEYGAFEVDGVRGNRDNYFDWRTVVKLGFAATSRHRFGLEGGYRRNHDPFGTSRTEVIAVQDQELDRWERTEGELTYTFGTPGAIASAEVRAAQRDKRYLTNRASTAFLDYDRTEVEYTLFYHFTPKTAAALNIEHDEIRFDQLTPAGINRDGRELHVRTGVRWLASAKTSGFVRVGYLNRDFDDSQRDAVEGLDWVATVTWAPLSRTAFTLQTGRATEESYLRNARVIDTEYAAVSWTQDWTGRFKSEAYARYTNADFVGAGRTDDILAAGISGEYAALSTLSILGGVNYNERRSGSQIREFDRLYGFLGVRVNP